MAISQWQWTSEQHTTTPVENHSFWCKFVHSSTFVSFCTPWLHLAVFSFFIRLLLLEQHNEQQLLRFNCGKIYACSYVNIIRVKGCFPLLFSDLNTYNLAHLNLYERTLILCLKNQKLFPTSQGNKWVTEWAKVGWVHGYEGVRRGGM